MNTIVTGIILAVVLASLVIAGAIAFRYILLKKKKKTSEMPQDVQLIAKVVIIMAIMFVVYLIVQIDTVKDFLQPMVNSLNEMRR